MIFATKYLKKKKVTSQFFITFLKKYQYYNIFFSYIKKFNVFPINIEKDLSNQNYVMYKYNTYHEINQKYLFEYSNINSIFYI